ncbi:ATP-grasp domain-containing protein [Microbacterium sp. STN6]|uniref:ATP-binding protein n=1 Tax=Microbacterium sp. STN6 TaxID=2995588 RepID=UPI002260B9EB|nr:biotin carboxylase N-terminal domain-containing protein [Microbacterium sp. STN6]MCX7521287.1 ATP-grasp domain-containing protein [Microbacterium sp. STN6]
MFDTVLVANRGEIACRIMRTLAALGIRSIAVFSEADRGAKHVRLADAAVCIGPAPAAASYLNVAALIAAARATGAQAIHPGYGFLSESAGLAAACADAGIVFVGPGVHALEVMGDKIRAKEQAESAGVATIPGEARPGMSDDALQAAAERIGFPVLVKPSAGGGGKGMQVARNAAELGEALPAARRVAASAFGDDTLFLERLIERPRHIEVQVLADTHGAIVHLAERECSLQRRHQKVIEEAPSPVIDEPTRARLGDAACRIAHSVDYVGAGTIEFLISDERPDEFFFMEMNTRLQVEHPVTELVTGIDLVEQQLRVAAGEPLAFTQADVRREGHAVEARLYAENPERGFLPTSGTVLALHEPSGAGVRVDSGLAVGTVVGCDYDPMLAKIVAHGADRAEALARLEAALAHTVVLGVPTNAEYLRALVADPDVRAGRLDTGLIENRLAEMRFRTVGAPALAAAALLMHGEAQRNARSAAQARASGLWQQPSGWRLAGSVPSSYALATGADAPPVVVLVDSGRTPASRAGSDGESDAGTDGESAAGSDGESAAGSGAATVTIDGAAYRVRLESDSARGGSALLELDGVVTPLTLARDGDDIWVAEEGCTWMLQVHSRERLLAERRAGMQRGTGAAGGEIRTPMPGTVVQVAAADGDEVAEGDTIVIVEAMKMEHRLRAPQPGVVHLEVGNGERVRVDQVVARVVAAGGGDASAGEERGER